MITTESKLNTFYNYKNLDLEIKDVDLGGRIVKGYINAFDVLDSDRDVLRKGAFKKSIQERGPGSSGNRKIAHLRNHEWNHQIGKFLELEEDNFGLKFVSKLGTSTKGDDALRDYDEGILREHSFGFGYVQNKLKFVEDSSFHEEGHWEVTEVNMFEGSGVTFGSNEHTPVIEVNKSIMDSDYLRKLNDQMTNIAKALRNGGGTDERLGGLEMQLKQIQQKYNLLIDLKPSIKETIKQEPDEKKELALQKLEQDRKNFYLNIIK